MHTANRAKKGGEKVVLFKTSAVFSVIRGTSVKNLLAKSCQAPWVSVSFVCKQIVELCLLLQKSNCHRSKRHAELAQHNVRNPLLLLFPCNKTLSATAPLRSHIKLQHLYQVSDRFPFTMSSSPCTPHSQSWHPAAKPMNSEQLSGLPISVTASSVGTTNRKQHHLLNLRIWEHAGMRAQYGKAKIDLDP